MFVSQEAAAAKTLATHEADDNRGYWESEVKARSKLGLRVRLTYCLLSSWF